MARKTGARRILRRRSAVSKPRERLSEMLTRIANDPSRDRISVGDLLDVMNLRAFGALILIFGFPNMLPAPPGLAGVLGLPLIFLSFQMMLGRLPYLPGFITRQSTSREAYRAIVERAAPWLARAERLLKQRLSLLTSPAFERFLGLVCLVLSLVLVLPIPFGNMLPAFALCVIALGLLERDGIWVLAGLTAASVALAIVGGIAYAVVKSAIFVILNAF